MSCNLKQLWHCFCLVAFIFKTSYLLECMKCSSKITFQVVTSLISCSEVSFMSFSLSDVVISSECCMLCQMPVAARALFLNTFHFKWWHDLLPWCMYLSVVKGAKLDRDVICPSRTESGPTAGLGQVFFFKYGPMKMVVSQLATRCLRLLCFAWLA